MTTSLIRRLLNSLLGIRSDGIARAIALACLLIIGTTAATRAATQAESPTAFIEQVGDQVVEVLTDGALEREQRLDRLISIMNDAADLDLVARLVLGRNWREATPEQQDEYVRLFRQLLVKTMAERLDLYSGETIEVEGATEASDRDTIVSSTVDRPAGTADVNVEWRVREQDDGYAVIDIVAEGVSLVVTQRSEVSDIVDKRGIDGLLDEMRNRVEAQKSG